MEDPMSTEEHISNIFRLDDPSKHFCSLTGYTPSDLEMYIEVRNVSERQVLYIAFTDIRYFCGPISWKGANFELAQQARCLELARLIHSLDKLSDSDILETFNLYIVRNERLEVTI